MYFVQKEGVYSHGVWFISRSKQMCIEEAKRLAKEDVDDYHEWKVYKFVAPSKVTPPLRSITDLQYPNDPEHEEVFSIVKLKELNTE